MIVVAIIGLLAAIAIPNFIKARATSQQNACINNLKQIDGAISEWALEVDQSSGARCFRRLNRLGLHQAELEQEQRSNLPGGRFLYHVHRWLRAAGGLLVEHVGDTPHRLP